MCSDLDLFHIEVLNLKRILNKNDYPADIIDSVITKFINRKMAARAPEPPNKTDDMRIKLYLVLPYLSEKASSFGRKLTNLVNDSFPDVNLRVMFKAPREIKSFFRFKDLIPKMKRSSVVYKISCLDCNSFYIGETKRHLHTRIQEHMNDVGKGDYKSSVFEHSKIYKHNIDYDGVEILDTADTEYKLKIKEMLYIDKEHPKMNIQIPSLGIIKWCNSGKDFAKSN